MEAITSFWEAYSLGVATSKGFQPNYPLAEAAFKRAWELGPRENVRRGETDSGLFEIPTRLARVYRQSGQLDRAQRVYEWVLKKVDSQYAKVGLAAVQEEHGRHAEALELYEEVLAVDPNDSHALRGMAKTLSSLGRIDQAIDTYYRAAEAGESRKDFENAVFGLKRMREDLQRAGESNQVQWVDSVLWRLRDS